MRKFIDLFEESGSHTPPEYEADDEEFYQARDRTGFFGNQAAGCLILAQSTAKIMLVHRSPAVDQPGTWGNCGGAHKASEEPRAAAKRELYEETGYRGACRLVPLLVFRKPGFVYSNFLAVVPDEFTPVLGWEADDFVWASWGEWPQPLHFGPAAIFADPASVETIKRFL